MSETAREVIVDVVRGDGDADQIIATLADAGFVIVPKEPTPAMVRAVDEGELLADEFRLNPAVAIEAWRIMIAAATGQSWRPGQ